MAKAHAGWLVGLAVACSAAQTARADAPTAKEILDAAGVKGGLVVHLGCGDGKLTAALHASDRYLVHGLAREAGSVARAREHVRSLGLYGKVSADRLEGGRLPYVDNLVNLVVAEETGAVAMSEVMRVLCPGGVAYVKRGGRWARTVKPYPAAIDEWTHFLHDASNNAVAKDARVGPPRRLQWLAPPKRSRDHDSLASLSAMTSTGGRVFYIYDEGPTSLIHHPADWKLIARDAFNGKLLWKRDIPSWITHLYYFRSGPVWLGRRLVSTGRRVYTTLGLAEPVTALDAETGKALRTYEGSDRAEEILHHEGVLLVAVGDPAAMNKQAHTVWAFWEYTVEGTPPGNRSVRAYQADTGELLWRRGGKEVPYLLPLSLTAAGQRVFYMDSKDVCCIELATGKERWRAPLPTKGLFLRNYAPTVVAADGVLLCLTMDRLAAFSIESGAKLWETKGYKGFASPGDLFVIDGLAWTLPVTAGGVKMPKDRVLGDGGRIFQGIDIHTGEVKRTFLKKDVWPGGHHHRCYRNKATERYLITSRRGLEFVDLRGDGHMMNWWIRGECQYGLMPCNGLIYAPPDPCRCFNLVKVDGFCALAAKSSPDERKAPGDERLTTGPAYAPDARGPAAKAVPAGKAPGAVWHPPVRPAAAGDWPTYRGDVTRSGSTGGSVPTGLKPQWQADVAGRLTSPVAAGGRLFVASTDGESVHCLDAETGRPLWRFIAGGRVDSPPTVSGGLAVFGSRDGHVYALRAADGKLAWRFRAAPADRRTVVDDRLESVWPVHGSVLVLPGGGQAGRSVVYFAAGRSSYLDGGIHLFGLDLASGRKLHQTRLHAAAQPVTAKGPAEEMTPALPDVLVSNGTAIHMRHVRLDRALARQPSARSDTLISCTGLLEDAWAHRHNCSLGFSGSIQYARHNAGLRFGPARPFGKLVVFDKKSAYAVQTMYTFLKHSPTMFPTQHRGHLHQKYATYKPQQFPTGVRLYAQDNKAFVGPAAPAGQAARKRRRRRKPFTSTASHKWEVNIPLQVRAMVLAKGALLAAGWVDSVKIYENPAAPDPRAGRPFLWIIATEDGTKLAEIPLEARPVFDGMIAAGGKVYVSMQNGKVACFGSQAGSKE